MHNSFAGSYNMSSLGIIDIGHTHLILAHPQHRRDIGRLVQGLNNYLINLIRGFSLGELMACQIEDLISFMLIWCSSRRRLFWIAAAILLAKVCSMTTVSASNAFGRLCCTSSMPISFSPIVMGKIAADWVVGKRLSSSSDTAFAAVSHNSRLPLSRYPTNNRL